MSERAVRLCALVLTLCRWDFGADAYVVRGYPKRPVCVARAHTRLAGYDAPHPGALHDASLVWDIGLTWVIVDANETISSCKSSVAIVYSHIAYALYLGLVVVAHTSDSPTLPH